jgi:peptidyl-prolyl cis-trans isomerase C
VSRRFVNIFLGVLLGGVALLFNACAKKENIVAKVGKYEITAQEFKDGFIQKWRGEQAAAKRPFEDRLAFVNQLADDKLYIAEAYAEGIDKRPEVAKETDQLAERKALDLLYDKEIVDKVITEDAIKEYYKHSGEELNGRHILLKLAPPDTSAAKEAALKVRIDSIRQAIVNGLDFGKAATLYSEDATTARDSGKLGWFSWGKMVDEFQDAAWKLKVGEVSQPVRSPYGWHLILIEERRPVPQRPYGEAKEQIKQQMYRTESDKLNKLAREYLANLRTKAHIQTRTDVWDMMKKRVTDPSAPKNKDLASFFTEKEKAEVVATYKGGKVTLQDICDRVGQRLQRINWDRESTLDELVNSIVEPKLLNQVARSKGLYKKALALPEIKNQKEQQMETLFKKEQVTDKIQPDSAAIQAYYLAHLGDYIQDEERVIREIFIKDDSAKAARVAQRAKRGENFVKLTLQFNEKESTKADTGRIGPFGKRRMDIIGTTTFDLAKVGDIAGPLKSGKNWSIIQLIEIHPSRTRSFDEVRSEAERQWRVAKTDQVETELRDRLRKKFPVKIYDEALAKVQIGPPEESLPKVEGDTTKTGK